MCARQAKAKRAKRQTKTTRSVSNCTRRWRASGCCSTVDVEVRRGRGAGERGERGQQEHRHSKSHCWSMLLDALFAPTERTLQRRSVRTLRLIAFAVAVLRSFWCVRARRRRAHCETSTKQWVRADRRTRRRKREAFSRRRGAPQQHTAAAPSGVFFSFFCNVAWCCSCACVCAFALLRLAATHPGVKCGRCGVEQAGASSCVRALSTELAHRFCAQLLSRLLAHRR